MPDTKVAVAWLALLAVVIAFYWGSIGHLVKMWIGQEDYQHGFFVLPFALFLLWYRREMIVPFSDRGSWWGFGFLGFWLLMRLVTVYFNYGSLPEMSIIPFCAVWRSFSSADGRGLRLGVASHCLSGVHDSAAGGRSRNALSEVAGHRHADERLR